MDVAFNIAGVEKKYARKLTCGFWSTLEASRLEFKMRGALVTAEICLLCGRSDLFDIVSETSYSRNTVGREL